MEEEPIKDLKSVFELGLSTQFVPLLGSKLSK